MNKSDRKQIENRCSKMAREFKIKENPNKLDVVKFGSHIKKARYELLNADCLASKMFYKCSEEYKIVNELLCLIEEYRNHLDNRLIEIMLPHQDSGILNAIFYGSTDYKDCTHIQRLLNQEEK